MSALLALMGAGIGGGLWLIVCSVAKTPFLRPRQRALGRWREDLGIRLATLAAAALAALALTRWPVAVIAAGGLGFFGRDLFGGRGRRAATVDRSVAVAAWAEMLRDTLAASSGLEEAIAATAPLAAPSIRPALAGLVAQLGRVRLADALASLADTLADPTADLVVSALILAARGEAQSLVDLLGSLAEAARDDADMRLRVDANRARIRTSVKVIAAVTIAMVSGLVLFNATYLRPFDSAGGQVVLAAVFAGFAGGLSWLSLMSRYQAPDRFLAQRKVVERS
ncbi:MAG: type II secretion system protein [Actinomycetota bacterium]|nr:type II secretion system protein [Actinomycetota bacterium]